MHILYIHQYFATPHGTTGTRSYEFARRWVGAGHRVTVLTSVAQLTPADFGGSGPTRLVNRLRIDGIDILAVNIPYRQAMGFARRIWAFALFMAVSTWLTLRFPGLDVIYATSTPMTVGVPALLASRLCGKKYVFEVRDLWPEIPIAMGLIHNRLMAVLLRRMERAIYHRASAIVTLSPGMEQGVRSVAPARTPIFTIPNGADTDFFRPDADGAAIRNTHGWEGRFVCVHAGAMGRVNGLDLVIRAAHHFREDRNFLFVLVGEGKEKSALMAQRRLLGLDNVQFLDGLPKEQLPAVLAAADLCLMTVMPLPILEHNSANKFFDYLSAGRPVLLNYSGWQRSLIESARAGYGCELGNEADFLKKLELLRSDPARCLDMPRNARRLAMERFSRDLLAAKALEVVDQVTSTKHRGR